MNNHKKELPGKSFFYRIEKILEKSKLSDFDHKSIKKLIEKADAIQTELKIKNHALDERSKELNCLYDISRIFEKARITSDELIKEVLTLIPPAFQYPENTCVRITYGNKSYETRKFNVTPWNLVAGIYTKRKRKGEIEVYYLKEMPQTDKGPFMEEEKSLLHTIAREIGHFIEQKETEKALRAEQRRLVRAQKIARMGDFTWNVKTGSVFWSDTMFDMLGYEKGEVFDYARINDDIHHPDDLNWVTNWLQKCLESGIEEHEPMEYRLIRKNGEIITVQTNVSVRYENGKAAELFGTVQDITKRKKAEEERKKSDKNFRITLKSIGDAVISTDLDGRIVQMNPVAEKLTGWKNEIAKDQHIEKVFKTEDISDNKKFSGKIEKVLKTDKKSGLPNHSKLISKDDNEYYITSSQAPIRDDNGKITGSVLVFRDVTKEYKLQAKIEASEEIMRIAADSINGIFYAFDKELNITLSKGKRLDVFNLSSDEMVGKSVFDFYQTADRNHPEIKMHINALKGKSTHFESETNGWLFSIVISPIINQKNEIIGGVGLANDITGIRKSKNKQRITQFAVDKSQIGIFQMRKNGTIAYVNEFACKYLGYAANELTGMHILDIDTVFTEELFKKHWEATKQHGKQKVITTHKRKDGSSVPVEITVNYIKLEDEEFTFSYVTDISERIKAENVLKESEEKYRTVFENTGTATCILENDGTISLANDKFAQLAGFPLNKIQNQKKWMDFVFNEDLDRMRKQHKLRRINKEEALSEYDFRFVGRDEKIKFIHLVVDVIPGTSKSVASLLDITRQKDTSEKIQERERQLLTLMSNLPGMAYRCKNDKFWSMEFVSSGCEKLTGYKAEELVGNAKPSFGELIHEADWKYVWDAVQETQMNEDSFVVEYRIRDKSGKLHWVWEQGKIVERNIDGRGFIEGFIMDITERKEAEEELRQLKNDLQNQVEDKTKELSKRVKELERFHEATIEREFRIKQLRDEMDRLKENQ